MNNENSTKNKIIDASIILFSKKGFYETSVREIAKSVGIHVSSLYSHFEGKEIILDSILEYYKNELNKFKISDEVLDEIVGKIPPADILISGIKRINEYVASDKINKIISILLIEMYRNPKVRDFYRKWHFNENRNSVNKLFKKMIEKDLIGSYDPDMLSSLYNAFINSYYQELFLFKSDNKNTDELEINFEKQIALFLDLIKK